MLRKALNDESEMVVQLLDKFAFLSGNTSEISSSEASQLWGAWRITAAETDDHYDDLEVGHYLLFSPDNRVIYVEEDDYSDLDWGDAQPYVLAKTGLLFLESDMLFKFQLRKKKLTLRYRNRQENADIRVEMEFAGPFPLDRFQPEDPEYLEDY
ncbi:MAG: hypothetical protein OER22_15465 [Gammaproteobacteria bacterium]|nr:hypothetical protein [Gammaproteobacteria bacterium]MDH3554008.1 hypothetical protein [Gammaproteobacteria bacterium]